MQFSSGICLGAALWHDRSEGLHRYTQVARRAQINKDKWLVSSFPPWARGKLFVLPCCVTKWVAAQLGESTRLIFNQEPLPCHSLAVDWPTSWWLLASASTLQHAREVLRQAHGATWLPHGVLFNKSYGFVVKPSRCVASSREIHCLLFGRTVRKHLNDAPCFWRVIWNSPNTWQLNAPWESLLTWESKMQHDTIPESLPAVEQGVWLPGLPLPLHVRSKMSGSDIGVCSRGTQGV